MRSTSSGSFEPSVSRSPAWTGWPSSTLERAEAGTVYSRSSRSSEVMVTLFRDTSAEPVRRATIGESASFSEAATVWFTSTQAPCSTVAL